MNERNPECAMILMLLFFILGHQLPWLPLKVACFAIGGLWGLMAWARYAK